MSADRTPMVVAAARALCRMSSDACNVDFDDNWKTYSEDFVQEARTALDAAGAPELLDACDTALAFVAAWAGVYQHQYGLKDFHPKHAEAIAQLKAAIAAATGATP